MPLPESPRLLRALFLALVLVSVPVSADGQSAPAATAADGLEIPAEVCRTGTGCAVIQRQSAGTDGQGRALWVIQTSPRGTDSDELERARGEDGCVPYVYWLLVVDGNRTVEHRRILDVCNDGYGAAGVGDDEVVVGDNRFEHTRGGGSSWRWGFGHVVSLSPFRVLSSSESGYWAIASNRGESSWDWQSRTGTAQWSAPWCGGDGAPPEPSSSDTDSPVFTADLFPEVGIPADITSSGWRTADLAGCTSTFDGTAGHGTLLAGRAAPDDARFSVVATAERILFIDVSDDRFVAARAHGRAGDTLSIWVGPSEDYMAHCLTRQSLAPPWVIAAQSGRLVSGPPGTNGLTVERVASTDVSARFRVVLPSRIAGITVAYADSDDGRAPERTIATSALGTDVTTLGRTWSMGERAATCEVVGSALELVQGPAIVEQMVSTDRT